MTDVTRPPNGSLPFILATLEAEDDADANSAVGDDVASSTASVASSILKYRTENGRTYHAYKVIHQGEVSL